MIFKLIEKLLKRKQSDNFDNSYLIHLPHIAQLKLFGTKDLIRLIEKIIETGEEGDLAQVYSNHAEVIAEKRRLIKKALERREHLNILYKNCGRMSLKMIKKAINIGEHPEILYKYVIDRTISIHEPEKKAKLVKFILSSDELNYSKVYLLLRMCGEKYVRHKLMLDGFTLEQEQCVNRILPYIMVDSTLLELYKKATKGFKRCASCLKYLRDEAEGICAWCDWK